MNGPCEEMRDKIADYVLGTLESREADALGEHIRECAGCREYAEALQDERRLFVEFGRSLDGGMKAREERVMEVLSRSVSGERAEPLSIRRIIMKSRLTKIAAAAVIIIAVVFSITLLDKTTTSAYAVEQTIQAMRSVSSVHAYCTGWDNSQGETWVQINPETGEEEYHYSDQGNLLIVGTPEVSYFYHKDKNRVRIQKGYVPASEARISRFFEDMVRYVQEHDGKLEFHRQFDEDLQKEVIMVHVTMPVQGAEFIVLIDTQTKLPINIESIKSKPGQGVKSVDLLEYNVPIPEGIFDFEIPEGAEIVNIP